MKLIGYDVQTNKYITESRELLKVEELYEKYRISNPQFHMIPWKKEHAKPSGNVKHK